MAKKVIIELTETKARTVLAAVEEWFRLRMGQSAELANGLAFLGYKNDPKFPGKFDQAIQRRDSLQAVITAMFRIAFGCYGTPLEITTETHIASDIWSALRYALRPKESDGFCSEPFQMGPEPLPKITVEGGEDSGKE